jgi:hypothetical protein
MPSAKSYRTPGGRLVPPNAYATYMGIALRGHPTREQSAALYAIIDALPEPPAEPQPRRFRRKEVLRIDWTPGEPVPEEPKHVFVPGPADPAFVARVLHARGCDCRWCVEARITRRFT